jgi:hypothetical protein
MNKDFPSTLFEIINSVATNDNEKKDLYEEREKIINLSYAHSINLTFDETNSQVKILTHKYFYDNLYEKKTHILPWNLSIDFKKSNHYDIYKDSIEKNHPNSYYLACCKNSRAKFYPDLLLKGKNFFNILKLFKYIFIFFCKKLMKENVFLQMIIFG